MTKQNSCSPDNLLHSDSLIRKLVGEIERGRLAGRRGHRLALPVLHLGAEGRGHGPQERRAHRGHPRRHPALHPALDRPLPRRELPRPPLAAQPPRLPAARADALLHRGRSRDGLPQDHQARGNQAARSRRAAAGTCSPTPSTCSTRSTRRKATRPAEIPGLILRHNLYGLEICPRAAQLAELALVFKAREKSRRFFQPEHLVRPRIIELRDVRFEENELRDYIARPRARRPLQSTHAPAAPPVRGGEELRLAHPAVPRRTAIAFARQPSRRKDLGGQLFLRETHLKVLRVLEQAEVLTQRYHVVVANPPYLSNGGMNSSLKHFAKSQYQTEKSDLFAMFIRRGFAFVEANGFVAMITMDAWMFLPTCRSDARRCGYCAPPIRTRSARF